MLTEFLVQILLQVIVVKCIALLMLGVSFTFYLQTLVRKVHIVILIFRIVLCRARPQITMFVEVNTKVISDNGPNTNVELASVE